MKSTRILNGYRVIYKPDHFAAMKSENWSGYIYEHIYVATKYLGRPLRSDECVHHFNGNKQDNRQANLIVMYSNDHTKLHNLLGDIGGIMPERDEADRVNSGKPKAIEQLKYCPICDVILDYHQKKYCSELCSRIGRRKVVRPSKEQLQEDINTMSMISVGKKYKVSDNAVKKWAKSYGIVKAILSQASGTPEEGATTSGEVQPS